MSYRLSSLLFLLVLSAVLSLVIVDLVFLSTGLEYRHLRNDGYSLVRKPRGNKSGWGYESAYYRLNGSIQPSYYYDYNYTNSHFNNSSNYSASYYYYNDSYDYNHSKLLASQKFPSMMYDVKERINKFQLNKTSHERVRDKIPQSNKTTNDLPLPPEKPAEKKINNVKKPTKVRKEGVRAVSTNKIKKKPITKVVSAKLTEQKISKEIIQTIGFFRKEYSKSNVSCSIGKSRDRMLSRFGTKFDASLPVFIDKKVQDIPNIIKYNTPFGFNNTMTEVLQLLKHLPQTGMPKDLQSKSCLRCVIVGSGGILKKSALGNAIDNFDVVIRMNDAPIKGFERDVGAKTTIRIAYPESALKKDSDYDKPWLFLMMAFKQLDIKWLETMAKGGKITSTKKFWKKPALKVPKNATEFRLLNPAIVRETAFDIIGLNSNNGKMKANVPTTGTISIMLGLRLCDEVAIAGFGYDLSQPNAPMHYYDRAKMSSMKKSWTHNINDEKQMLIDLVKQGIVTDLTGGIR